MRGVILKPQIPNTIMTADIAEASSSTAKPLIVRVKRKASQSPLEALWLEINERPLKRPLLDFEKLSISDSSKAAEIWKSKKVLIQHVETVSSSKAAITVLQSIVPNSDDATDFKTKVEERRQTFKQENKQDQQLSRAREKHEDMAKNARFEQIWKRRKGKVQDGSIHELCHIYDVVRVDVEEEIPKEEEQTEDTSLEDNQMLCNFLPLIREFLPDVAAEIQSDMHLYINSGATDDYVYDLYAIKGEMNTTEEEDALNTYPLVQVGEDDDYCDGPNESEWDTSDSNAEDNPLNEYPDEVSSQEDEDTEEEEVDEDEEDDDEGPTCVNGSKELDKSSEPKISHSSEDDYSCDEDEDEDEDDDTLAHDEDADEDSWRWKHR